MNKNTLERLRHRVAVFAKTEGKTEFNELSYGFEEIRRVWAEILPLRGKEIKMDGGSLQEEITHKITTRMGAIKEPRNDMFFEFKGQRFEVLYFMPNYKRNDLVEFYCKLIIEGANDYGKSESESDSGAGNEESIT